jgi:vacuolar-type H+-ATPase subunit I/STV1
LFNLAIVALLGTLLRTKILFPLPWIDQKNLINAHSHFAFGAWISLSFLTLFTETLLPESKVNKPWYNRMLWGLQISSTGMLLSFPFLGYGGISIFFSTLFILFSYGYAWAFLKDMYTSRTKGPELMLSICALACMVISSAGPFTLAYVLASGSSNAILYKDAVYFYLHFQYNGFFTLAVFALLMANLNAEIKSRGAGLFAKLLCISIIPSFFLTLLWHPGNWMIRSLAITGVILLFGSLFFFVRFSYTKPARNAFRDPLALLLCRLVLISFVVKTLLQVGTVIPELGHAVFGLRPIIIGFLHLVFLGLTSFYILSEYIRRQVLHTGKIMSRYAITGFMASVVAQETILLVQGIGLLEGISSPLFNWILWILGIMLFLFALLMGVSAVKKSFPVSA